MTKPRKRRHESGTPEKEKDGATEELKAFIEEKTGEAVKEIKRALDQRITLIEDSLNFAYESITVTSQKANALEKRMGEIDGELLDVKQRVTQLEQEKEETEKIKRRSQLIFAGRDLYIPENDEQIVTAISATINRLLELEVPPGHIVYARRLQRNRVLVRFASDERGSLRDEVFRAKYRLRGHKIFINEDLTPKRQEVLKVLLDVKREKRLSTVLTRDGEVFFAVSKEDRLIRVRSREEAEHLLSHLSTNYPAAAASPLAVEPGVAPAPVPAGSRDPGRAAVSRAETGTPGSGESTGAEACPAPARGELGEELRTLGGRTTGPPQLEPRLPGRSDAGPRADRRDGVTRRAHAGPAERAAAGLGVPGLDREAAGLPALGSPLSTEHAGGCRPEHKRGPAGAERRRREATEVNGAYEPGDAPPLPAQLDAPVAEVWGTRRESVIGEDMGTGSGLRSGRALGQQDRVGRRASSVPPGRVDCCNARHLSPKAGKGDRDGADCSNQSNRFDGPVRQTVGLEGKRGPQIGTSKGSGGTGDIRRYLKLASGT